MLYIYTHIYTYIYRYTYIHAHIYTHIYVCMCQQTLATVVIVRNCYGRKFGFIMIDAGNYQRPLDKEVTIHDLHFYKCALASVLGRHCLVAVVEVNRSIRSLQ